MNATKWQSFQFIFFRGPRMWVAALVVSFITGVVSAPVAAGLEPARQPCENGLRVEGVVTDPTGALIPNATVAAGPAREADQAQSTITDSSGRFVLPCAPTSLRQIVVRADGFSPATLPLRPQQGRVAHFNVKLSIARVEADVQVNAEASGLDSGAGVESTLLAAADVQRMPDDPDDFLRQLQVLASASGGDPTSATILIDGFQNAGSLPPKGSIESIRVNPDLFSAEYQSPPWGGGVIEIVTKPGADNYHGAVFYTDSNSAFNATDPFSVTSTPAGKIRYGFELAGPIRKQKSGFALALEKRDIDEFNVVNAITLDANEDQVPLHQTVAAPQRLWEASARGDWQTAPKDRAMLSFSANTNNLGNQGIGGLVLPEAGYSSLISEYDLRLSNSFTASANLLHETRVGLSWKRTAQTPLSSAPALEVAGFFSGGGASSQNLNDRERDLEIDHDAFVTRGKHTFKIGIQSLGIFVHDYDPDTFNGAYVFGGGSAPVLDSTGKSTGATTSISAMEQYGRALKNLPGGAPTTYQLTYGTPLVPYTLWRISPYIQDSIKLLPRLTLDAGIRYQVLIHPSAFNGFDPRAGLAWSLDRKQRWLIHLRGGLFNGNSFGDPLPTEVFRLNGTRQHEVTIYSPSYAHPTDSTPGSIAITAIKKLAPTLTAPSTFVAYFNVEHELPQHFIARLNLFWAADWNSVRVFNINAPRVPSSAGVAPDPTAALLAPRPIAPNENIFEYQNSGHFGGNIVSFNIEQNSLKRLGLSFRYGHANFKANVVEGSLNSPQSTYSSRGETARVEWSRNNSFTLTGHLLLPFKADLSTEFEAGDGRRWTPTTGTDNNGDGDFNDRPSYASGPGPGVYATRFGLLTDNTVNGNVPRSIGTMPTPIQLDANLSRAFTLSAARSDHPRTLTFNVRSANLLNHINVTAVSSVVSSPTFSQAIAADPARRIELGARFAF